MKDFLIFTIFISILTIVSSLFKKEKINFFDKTHTNLLKGFAILTVFWAHIGSSYGVNGIQWIAAIGVSLFLILSGYGLRFSFKKTESLNYFWKKRFFAVIVPYWIVYLVGALFTAKIYNLNLVLEILLFIRANWYVRYILVIYLIYWFVLLLISKFNLTDKLFYFLLFLIFLTWFVIETLYFAQKEAPSLIARQMFAFPIGILFYDYFIHIKNFFIMKKYYIFHIIIGITSFLVFVYSQTSYIQNSSYLLSNSLSLFTVLPMALTIIWISVVFEKIFNNYLFYLFGTVSYEIFLIQYFSRNLVVESRNLSLYICFFTTLIISFFFHFMYKKILLEKI